MTEYRSDPKRFNDVVIHEFRANGGIGFGELAGMTLLLLTTTGARSGEPRTTPLAYHRRGNRYIVIASNGGDTRHPGWYRNLQSNRDVTVEVDAKSFPATARILEASERDVVFAAVVERSPTAGAFQEQARRVIPVIELKPKIRD
jgi:deazaflavin-dependent oxidoreductase (nitroreductase family)